MRLSKKKSHCLFYLIGLIILSCITSCEQDNYDDLSKNGIQHRKENEVPLNYRALYSTNHTISVEEAKDLANKAAEVFINTNGGLKSSRNRIIEEARVMGYETSTLRSSSLDDFDIPDTLAYLFNFADSAGYVIVSADDRVNCPILAFVEDGTLGVETDNPGLAIILENMEEFLIHSIREFEEKKDSLLIESEKNSEENPSHLKSNLTETYTVIVDEKISPLIYTHWGQDSPYNNLTPLCTQTIHTPAGCVAVATAQIMAYYEHPKKLDGVSFNWFDMKVAPKANDKNISGNAKYSIAKLMSSIGTYIDMNYSCESSGAKIPNAVSWLKSLGYQANSINYSWEKIKNSLDSKNPILMGGFNKKTVSKKKFLGITIKKTTHYSEGHAWVVDGYTTTTTKNYSTTRDSNGSKATKLLSTIYNNSFLNINWGWNGYSDGYYAECVFKPRYSDQNYQYKQELYIIRR